MKICELGITCDDLEDRVRVDVIVAIPLNVKEELLIRLIRQYFAEVFADSNVSMKRPMVFDYTYDSWRRIQTLDGFHFLWELRKKESWYSNTKRNIHTDLAKRIFLADHSLVTVYLDDLDSDDYKCPNCLFNRDISGINEGGADVTKPHEHRIGNACPVAPNSVEYKSSCREFRLDLRFLRFETLTSDTSIGVLEDGEKRFRETGKEVGG